MLLDEIIGQRAAIAHVLEQQQSCQKQCVIVCGAVGSGVSWTLNQIGIEWERRGGVALKVTGAAVTPPRTLLPWLTMVSPVRGTLARWEVLKGGVAEASKAIPLIGGVASYLVSVLLNYRRKKLARQTQVLGEKEQDLLFVIETAAQGKRLLLLVDQLSNWDDESWSLLELILSPLLRDFYSSLTNVLVVMGASEEVLPRCRAMAEKLPLLECRLERLRRENLPLALKALDFPLLDEKEINLLFDATGGRLDLLRDFRSLSSDFDVTALSGEGNALYGRMIERRLRALKGDAAALDELLTVASFLGNSFSPEEASCLTGYGPDELQAILRVAEEERLLGTAGGYVSFPSIAMQQYFRASRIDNSERYHRKFAECLRRLRAGDYATRWQHLSLAGETDAALVCYCLASLDACRRRRPFPEPNELRASREWDEFASYLRSMRTAYADYYQDAIENSLAMLESIEALLSDALIAERDYLEALVRMKSHRLADLERVVTLLQPWLDLKEVEPEIWSRVAQTLMVALSETNRYEDAGHLEEVLTKYYRSRRTLDPWALYELNCLRRQSECLHHLVPSRNRLESALAYFGPTATGTLPRHPLQYYYTLTTLVANLIATGLFAEATTRGAELERLIQNHSSFDWPALEVAANNSILAGYLADVLPLTEATELMRQIDDGRTELGDRILIQNNLAVLLIHGGDFAEAKNILVRAWQQLGGKSDSDGYHRYFVANNLAALAALAGDSDYALRLLEEAGSNLHQLYPAIRETLLRRHAMMPEALGVACKIGASKFDQFLKDHFPAQVGPQWEFYGRGFLLTDIQFWTSD